MTSILNKPGRLKTKPTAFASLSSQVKKNQPFIMDLSTMEYLVFQGLPSEISVDAEPGWYAVASAGRNLPTYQYTGNESIITFTISWYSDEESREDVIRKCKWLESLTMNTGYDKPPPELLFAFGELFSKGKFIMKKAPYKIGLFNREMGMYPQLASQEITLARIWDSNPTPELSKQPDY